MLEMYVSANHRYILLQLCFSVCWIFPPRIWLEIGLDILLKISRCPDLQMLTWRLNSALSHSSLLNQMLLHHQPLHFIRGMSAHTHNVNVIWHILWKYWYDMYDKVHIWMCLWTAEKHLYFRDWAELRSKTEGIPVVLQVFYYQLKGVGQTDLMIAPVILWGT